jgi:hypothetical protein
MLFIGFIILSLHRRGNLRWRFCTWKTPGLSVCPYLTLFAFRVMDWLRSLFFLRQPPVEQDVLIHEVSRSHTTTHHSRYDSFGRVISLSQRPLPDKTQHSQKTNFYAPDGIRTINLSRRSAADLRIRTRGHWDRRRVFNPINCTCNYKYLLLFMLILPYTAPMCLFKWPPWRWSIGDETCRRDIAK